MSRWTTPTARILTTALLAGLIWPAAAEASRGEPRFHIQSIEVRGGRNVSSDIVISESLLEGGRSYTEGELRDAVHRIHRLPFVLEADFALERGRERGRYVLVVDILEARRFFYRAGLKQGYFSDPLSFEAGAESRDNLAAKTTLGARAFVGSYNLLFAAAGNEGAQVGFTRYNLFDRNVFLSLGYSWETCCTATFEPLGLDPDFSSWIADEGSENLTLTLGVPLGRNQSLRGSLGLYTSDDGFRHPAAGRVEPAEVLDYENRSEEELRLAWTYDTTDDPVFPFSGTSLVVAVDYRTLEADLTAFDGGPAPAYAAPAEMSSEMVRLAVLGRRHWPFAWRHSFAAGLSVAAGRAEIENVPLEVSAVQQLVDETLDTWELAATIRHTMSLHEAKSARRFRQLYWRNRLEYSWGGTSPDFDLELNALEVITLSSEVVYRSAWGMVSFGIRLIELEDVS